MGVKQKSKSLNRRQDPLADSFYQLEVLNGKALSDEKFEPFGKMVAKTTTHHALKPLSPEILQINIGKLCNQTCAHCHVDAGPDRKEENMSKETLKQCLRILDMSDIKTVDITGGAPEMNPHFRWFVKECRQREVEVINRCNLTILMAHEKYADLPEFFRDQQVHIVSSLPYFSKKRTDSQRGDGVFEDSIAALKRLNDVGYGKEGTGLTLDLVYNPAGAFLPGDQASLESQFKDQLHRRYDIVFNSLFAITNMPISRFLEYLLSSGNYEHYMSELVNAYNPATVDGLMCRNTLSVSWEGFIYDCDFNQMLELKVSSKVQHIKDFDLDVLMERSIVVNQHCYGCTAGAGSSCGGETV